MQWIRSHQHIDVMAVKGTNPAELEFLFHIHINVGPSLEVGANHLQQPLVAGMTLHPDPQATPLTLGKLTHQPLGVFELRQQPVCQRK